MILDSNSASGGYDIDNSLKFEADNSEHLYFVPSSTTNNKVWTFSAWIKRTELGVTNNSVIGHYTNGDNHTIIRFDGGDKLDIRNTISTIAYQLDTDMVFRDTSAWYHIVVAFDTTQATAANRTKVYVNGSQVDLSGTYTAQNVVTYFNTASKGISIGAAFGAGEYMSGYMTEINFVDGSQLDATSFGEYDNDSGIWKPKEYTGSHGTNGFYLDFEDSSSLGADDSGNGNNFTLDNISAADQATDTPTNNFSILNIRHRVPDTTRKEGATTTVKNNNGWRTMVSTLGVSSGKWYFELSAGSEYTMIGVSGDGVYGSGGTWENYLGSLTGSLGYYGNSATYYQDGSDKSPTNVSSFVADDIIGMALDVDNGKVYFHKNGTYQNQGNPNSGTNGYTLTGDAPYFLGLSTYQQSDQCEVNYGGYHVYGITSGNSDANGYGNFEYAVPSGYYALCTKNLAEYG